MSVVAGAGRTSSHVKFSGQGAVLAAFQGRCSSIETLKAATPEYSHQSFPRP